MAYLEGRGGLMATLRTSSICEGGWIALGDSGRTVSVVTVTRLLGAFGLKDYYFWRDNRRPRGTETGPGVRRKAGGWGPRDP